MSDKCSGNLAKTEAPISVCHNPAFFFSWNQPASFLLKRLLPPIWGESCHCGEIGIMNVVLRLFRTVCALIALSIGCSAATLTWIGGDGEWSVPANWSGGKVPGLVDVAVINSGMVTADWDSAILGLTITGGRLQGVGTIRVNGSFVWSGGSMGSSFGFGEI